MPRFIYCFFCIEIVSYHDLIILCIETLSIVKVSSIYKVYLAHRTVASSMAWKSSQLQFKGLPNKVITVEPSNLIDGFIWRVPVGPYLPQTDMSSVSWDCRAEQAKEKKENEKS